MKEERKEGRQEVSEGGREGGQKGKKERSDNTFILSLFTNMYKEEEILRHKFSSAFETCYVTIIFLPKGKNRHRLHFPPVVIFPLAWENYTSELPHTEPCKREQI